MTLPSSHDASATQRRMIGPYVPVRRLGEGGMGIVYLAHDAAGRQVAVKVMRSELAAHEEFRARFRKEAEAAKRVARFCTAPLLDAGLDGDRHYLVTEYVEGPDLSAVVDAQGPLTGSNLDALSVGVATALAAIHRAGVVHRDLKPSNILLAPVGPRVIDFGIAQLADTLGEQTGLMIGTPSYMSPEQAGGEPVTAAADVFAWGCVIAYAGTGRPPFGGGATAEVLYRVVNHVPRLDGLDERLRPLVERALDKDPARRPTAQQLLDRLLGQEKTDVETATRIVGDTWTAAPSEATRREDPPVAAGRRRWLPVAAAGAFVAVAAVVLFVVLGNRGWGGGSKPTGPVATRDVQFDGIPLKGTVDSVRRRGTSVRVEITVKLMGTEGQWWPRDMVGEQGSKVALVDPPSGTKYLPASKDGVCLCAEVPANWLKPGDSLSLWATYADVPTELETVDVDLPGLGLFSDVPVSDE
ncbi:serine/threonine-protein kinase [Microbispora sp. NPDC049125]|uniref:serine/threonine-protein kinase n=1 Tax=Microbispora sp. NPDC049125 TaxID=3154929 RepID=UPI003467E4DF